MDAICASPLTCSSISSFFNRDLNPGCLVFMFSLRFSESKCLINSRRQFRVRKIFFVLSYGISQRQHVFRVYVIHSNCARLHNFFFFMMDYGENDYLHSKM